MRQKRLQNLQKFELSLFHSRELFNFALDEVGTIRTLVREELRPSKVVSFKAERRRYYPLIDWTLDDNSRLNFGSSVRDRINSETSGDSRNGKSNLELTKDKLTSEIPAPSHSESQRDPSTNTSIRATTATIDQGLPRGLRGPKWSNFQTCPKLMMRASMSVLSV